MDLNSNPQSFSGQNEPPVVPGSSSRPSSPRTKSAVIFLLLIAALISIGFVIYFQFFRSTQVETLFPNWKTDDTYIYYNNDPVGGSDVATFKALNNEFAQDKNWIYVWGSPMFDVDRKTFKIISGSYAADKDRIYSGSSPIPNADLATFQVVDSDSGLSKDKEFVYSHDRVVEGADPDTFNVIKGTPYAQDKNGVYFGSTFLGQGDIAVLGKLYIRIGNRIFLGDVEVTSAPDAQTFKGLSEFYAIDSQNVYFQGYTIPGADPNTFEFIKFDGDARLPPPYAKDKNGVYREGQLVEGVDLETVEFISYYYFKDVSNVYWLTEKIEGADPGTFRVVGDWSSAYAIDKNGIWARSTLIMVTYPDQFKDIGNGYGTDGKFVYYFESIMLMADPKTFKFLDGYYSRDEKNVYYGGHLLSSDAPNFRLLLSDYAKDSASVYIGESRVEGADPGTFRVLRDYYAKDKNHVFHLNRIIEGADIESFAYSHRGPYGEVFKDKNFSYLDGERMAP